MNGGTRPNINQLRKYYQLLLGNSGETMLHYRFSKRVSTGVRIEIGSVGNWRSGLGLAYPYFHEDVSASVTFV